MLGLNIGIDFLHDLSISSEAGKKNLSCQEQVSEWADTLRAFSDKRKDKCCKIEDQKIKVEHQRKTFVTNSKYRGQRTVFGMNGDGTYTFPNGVKYIGSFRDDLFHGCGHLEYPGGTSLDGTWFSGLITDPKLNLYDDLMYDFDDWGYCVMPDRRYKIEHESAILPADKSYTTNTQPTRKIPDGYYDSGDGFYHPKTKFIHKYDDLSAVVRKPMKDEHKWIMENCRKSSDEPVGPRKDLYEQFSGLQLALDDFHESKRGFSIAQNHNSKLLERWQAMRQAMDIRHLRSKMVHQQQNFRLPEEEDV